MGNRDIGLLSLLEAIGDDPNAFDRLVIAHAAKQALERITELTKPDMYWDWEDGECGFDSISSAAEDISGDDVRRLMTARELTDLWLTHRVLTVDEDGDADDFEPAVFNNEADALTCWATSLEAARSLTKTEAV